MQHLYRSSIVIVLALCILSCESETDDPSVQPVYARFHIRDAVTKQPVPGILLQLSGGSWSGISDSQGNIAYDDNHGGGLTFTISSNNYLDVKRKVIIDFDETLFDTIDLMNPDNYLTASYKFSNNYDDSSGKGHHGIPNGTSFVPDRFGAISRAIECNGTIDFVTVPDAPGLNFGTATDFSIIVWVNAPSKQEASNNRYLINKSETISGVFTGYSVGYTQEIYTRTRVGTTYGEVSRQDLDEGRDGRWHMLTWVFGRAGVIFHYQDDELMYEYSPTNSYLSGNINNAGPLLIGGTGSAAESFSGKLDDVRIYSCMLDEKTVKKIYHENGW